MKFNWMQTHIYLLHKNNEPSVKSLLVISLKVEGEFRALKGGKPYLHRHLVDNYRMPPLKKADYRSGKSATSAPCHPSLHLCKNSKPLLKNNFT